MAMTAPSGWEGILAEGETILWQGRPDSRVVWSSMLSPESAFGLFFAGFAAFWIAGAAGSAARGGGLFTLFPLFGVPFLLIGLHMVVGRILWDAYARGRTWYTLTDRAAYVASEVLGRRSLKSYPFGDMIAPELHDGSPGSVFFAEEFQTRTHRRRSSSGLGSRRRTTTERIPIGFRRIDDARAVYRLVAEHRERAARG